MSKKSGGPDVSQVASDSQEQPLRRFVAGHAQDGDPVRVHQPSRTMKQFEAQGLNALQHAVSGRFLEVSNNTATVLADRVGAEAGGRG